MPTTQRPLRFNDTQTRWLEERGVPRDLWKKWQAGVCFPGTRYLVDVAHVMGITLEELIAKAPKKPMTKVAS